MANKVYDPKYNVTVNLQSAFPEVYYWNQSTPIWMNARNAGLKTAVVLFLL